MDISRSRSRFIIALATILFAPAAWAQSSQTSTVAQANPAVTAPFQIDLPATVEWLDTNVDLRAGEKIRITATGTIKYPADKKHPNGRTFGPEGLPRAYEDLIHQYAVPDAGHGALVGRLGTVDSGQPFFIGESKEFSAPVAGRLYLGVNQSVKNASDATGTFHVRIEVLDPGLSSAAAANVGGPPDAPIPAITPRLLAKIPRRVTDPQGLPGDMVNVLVVGTEDELVQVFMTAGWVKVDSGVQNTVVSAIFDSIEKKDYLTMPMSTLYLFKRPQDYGFAHAEPVRVAMSRNHLRAWKSPYEVDARPLWCIAATHDIGFERDQRNDGVTHKIDPSIDGEREYVNVTLTGTGLVVERDHVTPADALTEAKTATGGSFHSDGRILVLVLKSSPIPAN
ncbi:MAG: LssY C-terminal domain-containing protein [Candidatus Acidiferrales bacterium]